MQGRASVFPQHMCLPNRCPDTRDTKARNLLQRKHDVTTGRLRTNCQVLFIKEYTTRAIGLQRHVSFNCLLGCFFLIYFLYSESKYVKTAKGSSQVTEPSNTKTYAQTSGNSVCCQQRRKAMKPKMARLYMLVKVTR